MAWHYQLEEFDRETIEKNLNYFYPLDRRLRRPTEADLRLFDLIERDETSPAPLEQLRRSLHNLLSQGARVDSQHVYEVSWVRGFGDGDSALPNDGDPMWLTPLELAAFLDRPKWIHLFHAAGLPVAEPGVIRTAINECSRRFLWELHDVGHFTAVENAGGCWVAAAWMDPQIQADLLAWGFDPNEPDAQGATALHHAIDSTVQPLLAAGADPNRPDVEGRTPFQYLVAKQRRDVFMHPNALDFAVLTYIAYGLQLDAPIISNGKLIEVRHWIERASLPMSGNALRAAQPAAAAALALLKVKEKPPCVPARRRADHPAAPQLRVELAGAPRVDRETEISKRDSGVTDRVCATEESPLHEFFDPREELPLARAIEREVFAIIEHDAKSTLPREVALRALQSLILRGANVECCLGFDIADEIEYPEHLGKPAYYRDNENCLAFLTPIELAAWLNAPKWLSIYSELGLALPLRSVSSIAAERFPLRMAFVRELYSMGGLNSIEQEIALVRAAEEGELEVVEEMLRWKDVEVDSTDEQGRTALHATATSNNRNRAAMILLLLDAGANPNWPLHRSGLTPFAQFLLLPRRIDDRNRAEHDALVTHFLARGAHPHTRLQKGGARLPRRYAGEPPRTARELIASQDWPHARAMLRTIAIQSGTPEEPREPSGAADGGEIPF